MHVALYRNKNLSRSNMKASDIRILIAERNRNIRDFLRREFTRNDFQVLSARDSAELFDILESDNPPHVIVLDADTPNIEGGDMLARIMAARPDIPVVVHGYNGDMPATSAGERAAGVVEKSGNPETLTRTVRDILRKHQPELSETQGEQE